ncbi:MAG: hypothetical protein KAI85_03435 [Halopseudomonas aestusnigri]|nr:hypothetical protein [Halopseudomonas aestusnigri]
MFESALLNWLNSWLQGVGCSLIAAGLLGIVATGGVPISVAFCFSVGFACQIAALVVELVRIIPKAPEGE